MLASRSISCLPTGLIGAALIAMVSPAFAVSDFCKDIQHSIALSQTGFAALKNGPKTSNNSYVLDDTLFEAPGCEVSQNASTHTLRCSWSFAYNEVLAENHYDYLLSVVPACLGSDVAVSIDQPVNHPDTYRSHIFQLSATQLRVTLKNKYALKKKFVAMIVEGNS